MASVRRVEVRWWSAVGQRSDGNQQLGSGLMMVGLKSGGGHRSGSGSTKVGMKFGGNRRPGRGRRPPPAEV
ncbi:hypothetical protein KFK09_022884 [Dendrobium nobile]|uniref:Uncharacterized protein n=1 Tax=Dendrobium nobile TaxID=94219 RepID=A0A8T3AKJ7_DENNO|nr:hypothetical protein KFK09_022884 [Dendrobium nobile]